MFFERLPRVRRGAEIVTAMMLALGVLGLPGGLKAEAWSERYWNPKPSEDDFVIPLPCDGRLALRRIPTILPDNWLTDDRVRLGTADTESEYADQVRFAYIAGSLSDSNDPRARFYYLGKYEVSADQFAAVMSESCPRPRNRGRLPVEAVSWFDAVTFTRILSTWLHANARDALPVEDGRRAFVRLPTETEWEFAARGGQAVGDGAFRKPLFPMEGPISDYAWYQGPASCSGNTQLIGLLKPNPLGLHDIVGNVEEIILEPFRLNRGGRLHGQWGGFIVKGGSCLTDRRILSTAMRTEYSYFNDSTGQEMAAPTTGFRIAIAAPVLVSHTRIAELRTDWPEAIRASRVAVPGADPAEALDSLAKATSDADIQDDLEAVAATVRAQESDRADVERRAVRSSIQAGSLAIRQYRSEHRERQRIDVALDSYGEPEALRADDLEHVKKLELTRARIEKRKGLTQSVYAAVLTQTAEDYGAEILDAELAVVADRYERMEAPSLKRFASLFVKQAKRWNAEGGDIATYMSELVASP